MQVKRLLILNAFGNNLGDQAIMGGFLRSFLTSGYENEIDFVVESDFIYEFPIREDNIAEINAKYDLIVIGGGGVIYNRVGSPSVSGWGFDIPLELIDELTVPYVVYAVGYNYRPYSTSRFPDHTAVHLQKTAERALLFSVREHETMRILREEMGVTAPMEFLPDPAIHVEPLPAELPGFDPNRPSIGLCLRFDAYEERFPPPAMDHVKRFMFSILTALEGLANDHGMQVVHLPHIPHRFDVVVDDWIKKKIPDGSHFSLFESHREFFGDVAINDCPGILSGLYQSMSVVLGKRLHSAIIPFSVETPVVAISSTQSNRWMMAEFGCPEYHIDVRDYGNQVTVENITQKILLAVDERSRIQALFRAKKVEFQEQTTRIHNRIMKALL